VTGRQLGRPQQAARARQADRERLADESQHLRASLADLDRELEAGNLDSPDYAALRSRYLDRSEAIDNEVRLLEEAAGRLGEAASATGPGFGVVGAPASQGAKAFLAARHNRLVLGWSAAGCFVAAALLVGLALAGVVPFARSSSPQSLSRANQVRIELAEAGVLAANKQLLQAVAVYDKVLRLDPTQPQALADGGWLVRLAGLADKSRRVVTAGDAEIAAAVKVAPGYALARAYDGVALLEDRHRAAAAVLEFRAMLVDEPSASLVSSVRPEAIRAFDEAGAVLPAALSANRTTGL
jgi:tetratricopeptide (TPR) repeat protein